MDQLEKFIQSNRASFDDRNPDPALWEGIEARLPQRQEARRISIWKITSVVINYGHKMPISEVKKESFL